MKRNDRSIYVQAGAIMMGNNTEQESDFPGGIGQPAQRALNHAGYSKLEQLTKLSETEILKLHGVGPKAVRLLKEALAERGQSFL